jgi:N-acetylglutamate synthase-like GNAT family acetyltransferase
MAERNSDHRAIHGLRHGALHAWARHHGFKGSDSDPLPESLKEEAKNSDNPHVAKMGNFAVNFGHKK